MLNYTLGGFWFGVANRGSGQGCGHRYIYDHPRGNLPYEIGFVELIVVPRRSFAARDWAQHA